MRQIFLIFLFLWISETKYAVRDDSDLLFSNLKGYMTFQSFSISTTVQLSLNA